MPFNRIISVPGVVNWDARPFHAYGRTPPEYAVFYLYNGGYPLGDGLPWYTIDEAGTLDECIQYVAQEVIYEQSQGRGYSGVIISSLD